MASKMSSKDYVPKRLGLQYDPPTIILEYLVPSSGQLYHHKMKMPFLTDNYPTDQAIDTLQNKHALYIMNKIPTPQLTALVQKLQQRISSRKPLQTSSSNNRPTSATSTASSSTQLTSISSTPQNNFVKNTPTISQNTTSSIGSKLNPISTAKPTTSITSTNQPTTNNPPATTNNQPNQFKNSTGFDEIELDEESDDGMDAKFDKKYGNLALNKNNSVPSKDPSKKLGWDEINDDYLDDQDVQDIDYNNYDLNKLSNEELQKHKDKMSQQFSKNSLRPGDKGYVYDKQVEFKPCQENDWDEDEDEQGDYDDGDIV